MSRAEVFDCKADALRASRTDESKSVYATSAPLKDGGRKPLFVVSTTEHRAQLALVEYLMPLTKWNKQTERDEYIRVLEEMVTKPDEAKVADETSGDTVSPKADSADGSGELSDVPSN